jgi:hypothetical protein
MVPLLETGGLTPIFTPLKEFVPDILNFAVTNFAVKYTIALMTRHSSPVTIAAYQSFAAMIACVYSSP